VSIFDDNLTVSLSKIGGPLLLFICGPAMAWIFWRVVQKDLSDGVDVQTKTIVQMSLLVALEVAGGIWMCRKGYGWFGGSKRS
jgi:hypothetical protein